MAHVANGPISNFTVEATETGALLRAEVETKGFEANLSADAALDVAALLLVSVLPSETAQGRLPDIVFERFHARLMERVAEMKLPLQDPTNGASR
jgi:hypothetical protein